MRTCRLLPIIIDYCIMFSIYKAADICFAMSEVPYRYFGRPIAQAHDLLVPSNCYILEKQEKIGKLTFFVLYYHTPACLDDVSGSRLQGSFLSSVHKNVLEIVLTRDVFCFQ